jgi:hypothetical protein
MYSIRELEVMYRELLADIQNVKTTAGTIALANARRGISEQLKEMGHHGYDFNC